MCMTVKSTEISKLLTYSHCSTVVWLTDRWTDQRTDMLNCRDAIASKNIKAAGTI